MADIFLSYARADQPVVEPLVAALEQAGYSIWWDRHLQGGHQFSEDIESAIEQAKAVLVVWSADAVKSEWVRDEAAYGRDHNKLVPVRIDDTLPPMGYRQRHAIDLTPGRDAEAMAALKDALDGLIEGRHEAIAPVRPTRRTGLPRWALAAIPLLLLVLVGGWWISQRGGDADTAQVAAANQRKSVAVLPFVAQSSSEDDQYFADGITEEILNRLDALQELRVLPRTTIFSLRDNELPLPDLAKKLGVEYVVEGSMRRSGENHRVTARLIRVADAETLWSHSYDGTAEDVLAFQSDIAEKVAGSLDVLLDESKLRRMRSTGIDDPQTYALFARASAAHSQAHQSILDFRPLYEASLLHDKVIAAAPTLIEAYVEGSDIYSHLILERAGGVEHPELPDAVTTDPMQELQRRLGAASERASTSRQRLAIQIYAAAFSKDWSRIPAMSREFYRDNHECMTPNWEGFLIKGFGDTKDFAEMGWQTRDCFRGDSLAMRSISTDLARAGRFDDARAIIATERAAGIIPEAQLNGAGAMIELLAGNTKRAIALARDSGDDFTLAFARAAAGVDIDEVDRLLASDRLNSYQRASVLAVLGKKSQVDELAAAIDARPGGPINLQGFVDYCMCGAPFDIALTPNYAAQLKPTGYRWPPKSLIDWPLKK